MPTATANQIANKFRAMAEALTPKIEHLSRRMTQNPTPKRNREYQSRLIDARNLERTQKALLALADRHEGDSFPRTIDGAALCWLQTKDEIGNLVRKLHDSRGYYDVREADDYYVTTPEARLLQKWIQGTPQECAERERLRKIGELEAQVKLQSIRGYFPTPEAVLPRMFEFASIPRTGSPRVLEPSAGNGNIADAVKKEYPNARVEVCEVSYALSSILRLKGHCIVHDDFMELDAHRMYDRILMNPPFENQQDIDHVEKAFQHLNEGGILVAIMSPSFEFRNNKKSEDFREFLEFTDSHWESLPSGSFKQSGTGVETRLLVVHK